MSARFNMLGAVVATVLVVMAGWEVGQRPSQYLAAFLILEGLMNGVFAALDGVLFYVFFEATLIPMFIIIGVWGGPNRVYAAVKFFLYTLLGSLLMLVALIYLYYKSAGSFDITALIDLLEQDGHVKTLAQPNLSAMSGKSAAFLAGGEYVFQVSGLNSGDIKLYPFGTKLTVTPTLLRTPAPDGRPPAITGRWWT